MQFRFTLEETSGTREIFRNEVYQAPLGGPCGELRDFEVTLEVRDGIPAATDSPPFFTFHSAGDYRIVAELIRADGTPTGLEVTVEGRVVETQSIEIHFVPVVISDEAMKKSGVLKAFSDKHADYAGLRIPDYFPLIPGKFKVVKQPVVDARGTIMTWVSTEKRLLAKLTDMMRSGAILSNANRVVAFLLEDDFNDVIGTMKYFVEDSAARTPSEKVIFLKHQDVGEEEMSFTVAHELTHTLPYNNGKPSQLWMTECGALFLHNDDADKLEDWIAHGHEITFKGSVEGAGGEN